MHIRRAKEPRTGSTRNVSSIEWNPPSPLGPPILEHTGKNGQRQENRRPRPLLAGRSLAYHIGTAPEETANRHRGAGPYQQIAGLGKEAADPRLLRHRLGHEARNQDESQNGDFG